MILAIPFAAMLMVAAPVQDAAAGARAATVAPVIGEDIVAIVHVNLGMWAPERFARAILGKEADEPHTVQELAKMREWADSLKMAGAKDIYLGLAIDGTPGLPIAIVPIVGGADSKAIGKAIVSKQAPQWNASEMVRGVLVAGTAEAVARVRDAKLAPRAEVVEALTAEGDAPVGVAIVPSTAMRRVLEETMPALPPEVGGGPITTVTKGLRWASLTMRFEPRGSVRALILAKDEAAAKDLSRVFQGAIAAIQKLDPTPAMALMLNSLAATKPQIQGDRLTWDADLEKATSLVAVPLARSREAARRSQCVNNLKQIALAMHNFYSNQASLPAAFSVSQDGKPLLSWRVHILPYLDQTALYKEFHLDEPWDSEHNKALIAKMPKTYACPGGNPALVTEGKTTYLTPRGPNTMFPGAKAVKFQDVVDGLSNTIMVVDATDDQAVIWTKPGDLEVAAVTKLQVLIGHHPDGANVGFGDGAVKFLKNTVSAKTLQALFTINLGEVIMPEDY